MRNPPFSQGLRGQGFFLVLCPLDKEAPAFSFPFEPPRGTHGRHASLFILTLRTVIAQLRREKSPNSPNTAMVSNQPT